MLNRSAVEIVQQKDKSVWEFKNILSRKLCLIDSEYSGNKLVCLFFYLLDIFVQLCNVKLSFVVNSQGI